MLNGVYWVELGSGDIHAARRRLAGRLGIQVAENDPAADDRLKDDLRKALAERRCLVVLEDVLTGGALQALDVTGPQGRTLCTAIHRSILDGFRGGGRRDRRARTDGVAVRLLEKAAGRRAGGSEPEWAPGDVERILAATGRHASCPRPGRRGDRQGGSHLRGGGGRPREAAVPGGGDYAGAFAAMRVALDAFPEDDARRYRQLGDLPGGRADPPDRPREAVEAGAR